jgi:hypothetical protein
MNIDLINYRREKAKETLADVKLMFGQQFDCVLGLQAYAY